MMLKFSKFWFCIVLLSLCFTGCRKEQDTYQSWRIYRGSADANQFSSLQQIDTTNVKDLQLAWTFNTGGASERSTIECNPLVIDDIIYLTSPTLQLFALNAASGDEIWQFDPEPEMRSGGVNRGLTFWTDGNKKTLFYSKGYYLYALDPENGEIQTSFGREGRIDLRENLGKDTSTIGISLTTPGIIFENLLILGSATGEGYNASPGHIRAYDVETGEMAWIFRTIPQKGDFGFETWKFVDGENYGAANNWGGLSLDEKRGWVFVATGSASYDFYGANRVGENLFANCVIALNARNGARIWHYQAVHHDLWDYDLACAPNLVTISYEGKQREVVIQPTKMGRLLFLDRQTGQPLFYQQEEPVPPSEVPGEEAHPTQPMNQGIAITRQQLTENLLTDISPEANAYALEQFRKHTTGPMYTPPGLTGTITYPSTRGGVLWGGASVDVRNQMLYVNANQIPMLLQVRRVNQEVTKRNMQHEGQIEGMRRDAGQRLYLLNCASCHGAERQGLTDAYPGLNNLNEKYQKNEVLQIITNGKGLMPAYPQFNKAEREQLVNFLMNQEPAEFAEENEVPEMDKYVLAGFRIFTDQEGFPASKPPWGILAALDLQTLKIKWQVPAGSYPELQRRGIPDTGTQMFGGCVATAGGLVFLGATADEKFRAFDVRNGRELWSYQLNAGGYATPAVYESNGRQFVVIAAGGGNRNGTPSGDTYYAFALPEKP